MHTDCNVDFYETYKKKVTNYAYCKYSDNLTEWICLNISINSSKINYAYCKYSDNLTEWIWLNISINSSKIHRKAQ